MPRYRQITHPDGRHELVEIGPERGPEARIHVLGDSQEYVSPIDATLVSGRVADRNHMARHGVVRQGDFGPNDGADYFARKERERDAFYSGRSEAHRADRRASIVEAIRKLETKR